MIAQVLVSVMLSGSPQAAQVPAPVTVVAPAPGAKEPEKVCRRERLTGSNVRQTVCLPKEAFDSNREASQEFLDRERVRNATSGGGVLDRRR